MKLLLKPLLILLLTASVSVAATHVDIEKKAKDILQKVSKKYKSNKSTYAAFTMVSENKAEKSKPMTEKGKLWIKGFKYKIEFNDQIIWCNGKVLWSYLKAEKELTIETYTENPDELGPHNLFTFYQQGFLSKFDGDYTEAKVKFDKVSLTPIDKKKPYFNVTLHVKQTDNSISKLNMSYKSGVRVTFDVTEQSGSQQLDTKFFDYDPAKFPADFTDDLRN